MKSSIALLIAGLTLAALQDTDEKPIWHKDWPTAQRIAKRDHKPIFAVLVCQH
jgi:hypothetical protein